MTDTEFRAWLASRSDQPGRTAAPAREAGV
jgi:hypothetical protein